MIKLFTVESSKKIKPIAHIPPIKSPDGTWAKENKQQEFVTPKEVAN